MPRTRIERFRSARRDRHITVLEGIHAIKHALRFGAEITELVTFDPDLVRRAARDVAPDLLQRLAGATLVAAAEYQQLAPHPPATGIIALARRRPAEVDAVLQCLTAPAVFLEQPVNLRNIGASIRVAAAAGAAGVMVSGHHDPWHPEAVRGAAGLQYALPVVAVDALPATSRPLIAMALDGDELRPGELPANALLAFGSERSGLAGRTLDRAEQRLRIPMQPAVASINLATAVGVTLYAWRLSTDSNRRPRVASSDS